MNIERLQDVIRALQESTDSELNMMAWRRGECGCAVGLYCKRNPNSDLQMRCGRPYYLGANSWSAVQAFFDLDQKAAHFLFSSQEYPANVTREKVIARIQSFIDRSFIAEVT